MAAVRHLEYHEVNYAVRLPCQNLVSIRYSPPEILQFYNFASFGGICLNTSPFGGFFGGFEPLNIMGRHPNDQKAHPLVTTRRLSHKWLKSVLRFDLGGVARKKYNQDRTRQQKKSQKRNISHIWGKASRKDIPMKLGTGVDVHEIVKWAKFDL